MNFFHTGNFVKQKQKGSPTKFLGFVRQQIFVENRDVPFVGIKLFDTRSFLKHRRVPLRNDSVLPDKTISTENRDTLLQKVQKSVPELMFVKALKTKFKTLVLFLTACKS